MRKSPREILAEFFLYQLPFFTVAGVILVLIYYLDLGSNIEKILLIFSLSLIVSTPYISVYILRRKYKPSVKRAV